jgi:CheY-like chemotaxis protein
MPLIIDDSTTCCEFLKEVLEVVFPVVVVREDANSGMDYLIHNKVNLLFLDLSLPGMSGMEALKQIKSLKPGIPVIIYSADAQKQSIELALSLGAFAYMAKPVRPREVYSVLDKLNWQFT